MKQLIELIKKDVSAYDSNLAFDQVKLKHFVIRYIKTPGFKVSYTMRLCKWLETKPLLKPIYILKRLKYRRLQVKYGIQIGHRISVGGGGNY